MMRVGGTVFRGFEATEEAFSSGAKEGSFGDLFRQALNDTSDLQGNAKGLIEQFLRGEPVEVHQLMAASEEASISLEVLVELRNKLIEAYRTLMNMQ
jgi:flagellar hook-basal body complex protein FliE